MQAGNNEAITLLGVGTVWMSSLVDAVQRMLALDNVSYAPEILLNFISVSKVRKRNFRIVIIEDECCRGRSREKCTKRLHGRSKW